MTSPTMSAPATLAEELIGAYWQGAHLKDPGFLARMREANPVLHAPSRSFAVITGHAEVTAALRHPAVRTGRYGGEGDADHSDSDAVMGPMMLFHNGVDHTRLRSLMQRAFTPRVLEESREFIASLTDDLLDAASAAGEVDFVQALAYPLPVTVIVEMLGLKGSDADLFRGWTESVADLLGGINITPERREQIEADARAMRGYFHTLADDLRANPQPGLLSALAAAEDDSVADDGAGKRLSSAELLANAVLLLGAGHETTSNLLGGSVHALAANPEQRAWLAEDPAGRAPNATEELLRFLSPVRGSGRFTNAALTLGGVDLPAGIHLSVGYAAANRDPRVYTDPEMLDLSRPNAKTHLAFAGGPHYCLGATLARLESNTFLTRLMTRFPGFQVPEQPLTYRPNFALQGLERLQVRLG
ncbi:cytochrome P450 [Deinococcus arenicola]|uniref:Cytochrome P450 n=1 Tax=Deinococcus arenicola TaxID=2994950 RepID=A0ABU4DQ59_9DEIO|nr:cytochrome P450 [Deinococcus sp. ZS9-10]MDV6374567.1 cytochrome P450 [Deinococcus sp. ZS9-10]